MLHKGYSMETLQKSISQKAPWPTSPPEHDSTKKSSCRICSDSVSGAAIGGAIIGTAIAGLVGTVLGGIAGATIGCMEDNHMNNEHTSEYNSNLH